VFASTRDVIRGSSAVESASRPVGRLAEELLIDPRLCVNSLAFTVCMHGDPRPRVESRDQPGVDDTAAWSSRPPIDLVTEFAARNLRIKSRSIECLGVAGQASFILSRRGGFRQLGRLIFSTE
jgi:hypothetical protein